MTTDRDLAKLFGAESVVPFAWHIGEGITRNGAVVFGSDPQRRIEIAWRNGRPDAGVELVRINGASSRWRTRHGVSAGTSLRKLELLNGRPFKLAGFGWDYAGTVTSWEGGALAPDFDGRVIVRLRTTVDEENPRHAKAVRAVMGDRDFSSDFKAMRAVKPRVEQLIVSLVPKAAASPPPSP